MKLNMNITFNKGYGTSERFLTHSRGRAHVDRGAKSGSSGLAPSFLVASVMVHGGVIAAVSGLSVMPVTHMEQAPVSVELLGAAGNVGADTSAEGSDPEAAQDTPPKAPRAKRKFRQAQAPQKTREPDRDAALDEAAEETSSNDVQASAAMGRTPNPSATGGATGAAGTGDGGAGGPSIRAVAKAWAGAGLASTRESRGA